MDCPYELGQHTDVARTAGVDSDEINAVTSEADWLTGPFNPVELAVLHLTTELLTTRNVSVAVFDQVHKALGSEATVEVLMVIDGHQPLLRPGADAQRARRRPRRNRPTTDSANTTSGINARTSYVSRPLGLCACVQPRQPLRDPSPLPCR